MKGDYIGSNIGGIQDCPFCTIAWFMEVLVNTGLTVYFLKVSKTRTVFFGIQILNNVTMSYQHEKKNVFGQLLRLN